MNAQGRGVVVSLSWIVGLLVAPVAAFVAVITASVKENGLPPGQAVTALVAGGVAGAALGLGPLMGTLLVGRRWGRQAMAVLVLLGVGLTAVVLLGP